MSYISDYIFDNEELNKYYEKIFLERASKPLLYKFIDQSNAEYKENIFDKVKNCVSNLRMKIGSFIAGIDLEEHLEDYYD